MLPISESYNNECIIGNGTKIKFRPWKTKDEKAFLTYVESVEEVTDEDFFEFLIKPCLEDKTIHLSDDDIQMVLIEIRKVSIGESFEMKYICNHEDCGKVNEIEIDFDDIVTYKFDKVKEFISDDETIKITFGNVKNEDVFKEKTRGVNSIEKTFIEMILRIEKVMIDGQVYDSFNYENAYAYVDNLDVKVFDKLLAYYKENKSSIKIEGDFNCLFCGTKNSFIFDEVPNFLAGW